MSQKKPYKKLTITASSTGVETAKAALSKLDFESESNLAKSQRLSDSIVSKFFNFKPIQLDSFKRICQALKLKWIEIAGIAEEKESEVVSKNDSSSSELVEPEKIPLAVTVVDKKPEKVNASIVLTGDIDSAEHLKRIESSLQNSSGETIKISDIKRDSIQLIIEGYQQDIERLVSQFKSGELKELSGFPIQDIEILSTSSEDDQNNELDPKWRLVEEIVSCGAAGRELKGVDLSDVDLSGADLSRADLSGANLSGADLSNANLKGIDLSSANLSDANLSDAQLKGAQLYCADLKGANLRGTDLKGADLSGAELKGADLRGADLRGADLIKDVDLSHANLRDAKLVGANLNDASLDRADLSGADLNSANLSCTNFSRADLSSTNLNGAKFRVASLNRADLSSANLSSADLRSADLSSADLSSADLKGANLNSANFSGTDLSDAKLKGADLTHANLSRAIVDNAQFGNNSGIDESIKSDLIERGAMFEDVPGDSSESVTPS
ncbi:pentapeptide repeat-containing protein [Moorena producens JHB]|uniref:Pentapeptide repeat-containing protein n=1 Tax=Moorena producens (strain JHB) TaxID=1454205 RepID=A0A1D9FV65_MOOP1|nr:pentapeptide repeat-containing protein [Moorena producens]AOY79164.1 pentapeptide repeat-containing protein [Moorena producens JHB]